MVRRAARRENQQDSLLSEDVEEVPVPIRIPVLSNSISMLSLPLAVMVAGNESDRPVINSAVQKIIVHADGEDILLAELNGFRPNGISAELQVLPALHMSRAGVADAFAVQVRFVDIVDLPHEQDEVLIPEFFRDCESNAVPPVSVVVFQPLSIPICGNKNVIATSSRRTKASPNRRRPPSSTSMFPRSHSRDKDSPPFQKRRASPY